MRLFIARSALRAVPVLSFVALAACSGASAPGGGSGTGDGTGTGNGAGTTAPNGNHVSLAPTSVSLIASNGTMLPHQGVVATFQGAGIAVGMVPGQQKPLWLSISAAQALSPTRAYFDVEGSSYGLGPGRYSTTLRVATADANGTSNVAYTDLPVALTVPQTVSPSTLVLSAVEQTGANLTRTLSLTGDRIAWEATTSVDASWLSVSPASGTGSASLTVAADAAGLVPGEYTGTVTVRDTFTNLTKTIAVMLAVEAHALRIAEGGIGLFSIGSKSRLSRTVTVTDDARVATPWVATSDQGWLSITGSPGTAGGPLTVTADPTGLSTGMHVARVTVAASGVLEPASGTSLVVGLYVDPGATVPSDPVVVPVTIASVYPARPDLKADPIRPFFYLSDGAEIRVFNGQTGVADPSIAVPGAKLTAMTIAPDGTTLYVEDSATGAIHPVDLASRTVGTAFTGATIATALAWSAVDGHDIIFTNARQAIDAQSGAIVGFTISSTLGGWESLAASPDGRALYLQSGWNGNHELARLETHAAKGAVVAWQTHLFNEPGDGDGLALSVAGERLYTSSPWHVTSGPTWDGNVYDARTMALVTHLVERSHLYLPAADGALLSVFTTGSGSYQTTVSAYGADLTLGAATVSFAGTCGGAARSGDDHRLGFLGYAGSEYRLTFVDRP